MASQLEQAFSNADFIRDDVDGVVEERPMRIEDAFAEQLKVTLDAGTVDFSDKNCVNPKNFSTWVMMGNNAYYQMALNR